MKIAIVGTGYVGLVTGTCLSDLGNHVVCIDKDRAKISMLEAGRIPIYEPGLAGLVAKNVREGRLAFSVDLPRSIDGADLIFIAVGTPQGKSGGADLSGVWAVGRQVAESLRAPATIVIKSTVPVGTNAELTRQMSAITPVPFDVASNPEFLKEGAAIDDFFKPDRVVVGARRPEVAERLLELYRPILTHERPFLAMAPESAEMTKYVANCLLASKISFINEMANLCTGYGAHIDDVRRGIGYDCRIGFQFLAPGAGYGGSCFPKDVRALIHMAKMVGIPCQMIEAVDSVNEYQKEVLPRMILNHFGGSIRGMRIAVWGLAFKPETDDIRESPALVLIEELLQAGAFVRVTDPQAMGHVREIFGSRLVYCESPYSALESADALAIVTDWDMYRAPNFQLMRDLMRRRIIFDGRNCLNEAAALQAGFQYQGIGRLTPGSSRPRTRANILEHVPPDPLTESFDSAWDISEPAVLAPAEWVPLHKES
ncbi:UDP-glucose 6-dehydrogenase [Aquisphaera giovannonii]|uniref:UDP-glucose 6-dehydrogenase n=1 Tax=Aquisphaera giovannonii TaxID=406548 RepID=A0A5B9W1S6_9BACT|nr:UDP-glucose/GDP-mannose dehydrogenase family protein [Aquisphaera giovannonii]QEH34219.1 UDP-glucose 6-dehydrogenase [Aquisphaera giovannonii]